jgi:predicted metal-dependent RNase
MADVPTLSLTLLGAGQEVGRSCCVLQYRNITLVLDAGVHPAHTGMASLPFIDELDWSTVDAILITQCGPLSLQNLGSMPLMRFQFPSGSCSGLDIHHRKGALSVLDRVYSTPQPK